MTRVVLPAVLTATFVFLLAPIIVVVLASFNGVGVLSFPPRAFTTRWYYEIDPSFFRALWVSLVVGTITATLAVLVGVPGALGLARGRFPGRDAINTFCLSPLMVPALVTGVALFQFSLIFWDLFGVTIGGTIAGLVIGHLTFAIPFVIRSVLAATRGSTCRWRRRPPTSAQRRCRRSSRSRCRSSAGHRVRGDLRLLDLARRGADRLVHGRRRRHHIAGQDIHCHRDQLRRRHPGGGVA